MNRLLIVDDDPDILGLLKAGLTKAGFEVAEATSAEIALEKMAAIKPDLLITDAMMPDKDGYQLSKELRHSPETASLPIIMLTALHQEEDALKAFQEGIDDFITKPFSMPVLRARVTALLNRSRAFKGVESTPLPHVTQESPVSSRISTGLQSLDNSLGGGLPRGSNTLVVGETGSGKSTLSRRFIARGLKDLERCMIITLDDDPLMVRSNIDTMLSKPLSEYERENYFRLVDCFSWCRGWTQSSEKFAASGAMELNQLAGLISDAGSELGQTVREKLGGRRVLDSVSSLFINFDLALVQRFLAQMARTASSYGGVSTIIVVEAGSVSAQQMSNIKYLVDTVIELKFEERYLARVTNMKWSKFLREWVSLEN